MVSVLPQRLLDIPLGLYVHWPWCVRKCPYCDFNSHRSPAVLPEDRYVDALLAELDRRAETVEGRTVETIFIGGGTPSLMSGDAVRRLMEGIRSRVDAAPDAEVTLEANPGAFDEAKFEAFRRAGVNRLSLGIQSFSDERLRAIGRIHDAARAREAVRAAGRIFENFNLDVMFALPGESVGELARELDEAVSSGATHLSFYQLTIEPGTAFAKRTPENLPDEDLTADMGEMVAEKLAAAGFEHYEVSGYARPGRRTRHNLIYWTFGDYLALGAGAHSKVTSVSSTGELLIRREQRWASPAKYMEAVEAGDSGRFGTEAALTVDAEALPFEFMLNALRLTDGVEAALFEARTGLPLSVIEPTLVRLRSEGLLVDDPSRIRTTPKGLAFLSDVQERFLETSE